MSLAEMASPIDLTFETQTPEDQNEAVRIQQRWDQLENAAVNWKTHWQECYEVMVPRKEDVIATRLPGDRRNSDIYDSTAILANEKLAAALHGMLTNPETKFFELTFGDPTLDDDPEVKNWCQDVGDILFRILNGTNFQTEVYEIYIDQGAIGTSCLYMGDDEENVIHFSARAMKEIRIDENNLGLVDVVYRLFQWRAFQIIQEFGADKVPGDIIRAAEKNSTDQFYVIHAVEPMTKDEQARAKLSGHRFKSQYILKDQKFILSKGGFHEFPYAVPRWSKTTGEIYGRGPGMAMLPDILMLQAMMLTVIQGAQKTVDPPLMVEDDGVIGVVRLTPGGLTVVRPGSQRIAPLITNAQIDFGQKMLEDVRGRIKEGFYVDQLGMQQGPQKTAEEVMQFTEDRLRLMGPVLGRQHFEFLRPVIKRTAGIAERKKLLPEPPAKIKNKKWDVRYTSMIARAQRMNEGQNMARGMALLAPIAQVKPAMLDCIDFDGIPRYVWDTYGLKHSLLLTDRALKQKRDQMAKQQQAAAQQQQEAHQAEVANKTAPLVAAMKQGQPQGAASGVPQA